jgi:hypothetical protein
MDELPQFRTITFMSKLNEWFDKNFYLYSGQVMVLPEILPLASYL